MSNAYRFLVPDQREDAMLDDAPPKLSQSVPCVTNYHAAHDTLITVVTWRR